MMEERGVAVDHSSINRRAIRFLPLIEKMARKHKLSSSSLAIVSTMTTAPVQTIIQSCLRLTIGLQFCNRLLQIFKQNRDDVVAARNNRTCKEQQACNEFVHVICRVGLR
jgi:hypothetical protein